MQVESPQFTERPVRLLTLRFANGQLDELLLEGHEGEEGADVLAVEAHVLSVHTKDEYLEFERGGWGVVGYRVRTTTLKTPVNLAAYLDAAQPSSGVGTPSAPPSAAS